MPEITEEELSEALAWVISRNISHTGNYPPTWAKLIIDRIEAERKRGRIKSNVDCYLAGTVSILEDRVSCLEGKIKAGKVEWRPGWPTK